MTKYSENTRVKKRLYAKLKQNFYWKNMSKDVAKFVKTCIKCQKNKMKFKNIEPLKITDTPQKPFDTIVVDTIGPFKTSINNNHGSMRKFLSDRGAEYVNKLSTEICKLLKINHVTSTAYHHETLGTVERNHRVLNEYLRSYVNENQDNWDEYLKYFAYCYNTTPHTAFNFKFCPFELVFAKTPNIPEFLLDNKVEPIYSFDDYAKEIKFQLQQTNKLAQDFLLNSKNRNKNIYDKKINSQNFKINDKVLLRNENKNKLYELYSGPYVINEVQSHNLTLIDQNNKVYKTHKNRCIKYM